MSIETQPPTSIRVKEMRRQLAASRWKQMDLKQRAKATTDFVLQHAAAATTVQHICKYPLGESSESVVKGMLHLMAEDYRETFGQPAPWEGQE